MDHNGFDNDYHWDPIKCKPYQGLLSARACAINLTMAKNAYQMLKDGVSLFLIDDMEVDRLARCSRCKLFPRPARDNAEELLLDSMRGLINKIIQWDEWGRDPELSEIRRKERGARYRERNKEEIRINKRIRNLERQLEGDTDG